MMDQLFRWTGDWTQLDAWRFVFRGAVLKAPIGKFPAGSRPLQVTIDFRAGTLDITDDVIHVESFEMRVLLEPAK